MDEELEQLAALTLCNAFWADFSALCNKYLEAAEGLDVQDVEMQMGELTSIYGRDGEADTSSVSLGIWTRGPYGTNGHETIVEALEFDAATEVNVQGRRVFERIDGEWDWNDSL